MVLHDAFAALRRVGLVNTHAAFSTAYLNKGARYYDHLICSRKPPSVTALVSLFIRSKAIADAFAAHPSLSLEAAEMAAVAHRIWMEVERRCCSLLPERRKRPSAYHDM